jgi:hypothetical protein
MGAQLSDMLGRAAAARMGLLTNMRCIGGAVLVLLLVGAGMSHSADTAADQPPRGPAIIFGPPPVDETDGTPPENGAAQPGSSSAPPADSPTDAFDERQVELAFWSSIHESSDPADFEAYLNSYPEGAFAGLARNRLAVLAADKPVETIPQKPALHPRELARMLQVELRRVGCSPGTPDGRWGPRSRRALERFNRAAGMSLTVTAVTAEALDAVRARDTVCRTVARKPNRPASQQAAPAVQPPSKPRLPICSRDHRRGGVKSNLYPQFCSLE